MDLSELFKNSLQQKSQVLVKKNLELVTSIIRI